MSKTTKTNEHHPHPEVNWIQHNKHPKHPLKEVYKNAEFECKTCKSEGKGMRFRCDECDFDMHTACATCPAILSTFAHPQHQIQLIDKPHLSFHRCSLCQNFVRGTIYRCKTCKFYMHPTCGQLPEFLFSHAMHPPHSLKIQDMTKSKCDVCDKSCKHWRYFCGICDVHIHVGCLDGKITSDDDEGGFGKLLGGVFVGVAQGLSG